MKIVEELHSLNKKTLHHTPELFIKPLLSMNKSVRPQKKTEHVKMREVLGHARKNLSSRHTHEKTAAFLLGADEEQVKKKPPACQPSRMTRGKRGVNACMHELYELAFVDSVGYITGDIEHLP